MKAYKVTLLVIDHDKLGEDSIVEHIENVRYPNHCLNPHVMDVQTAEIGKWRDDHPLNQSGAMRQEFDRLFRTGGGNRS